MFVFKPFGLTDADAENSKHDKEHKASDRATITQVSNTMDLLPSTVAL